MAEPKKEEPKKKVREAAEGMVLVQSLGGSIGFGEQTYAADENGIVEVPSEAVAELAGHGIFPVE